LLKAQIHPEFLFASQEKISANALQKDTVRASAYLLKLSELLSYKVLQKQTWTTGWNWIFRLLEKPAMR